MIHGTPPTMDFGMGMGGLRGGGKHKSLAGAKKPVKKAPAPVKDTGGVPSNMKTVNRETWERLQHIAGAGQDPSNTDFQAWERQQRDSKPKPVNVGSEIPVRPNAELASPVNRAAGGKFESNPTYQKAIKERQNWNAGMSQQYTLQGQQWKDKMYTPKSRQRQEGYGTPKRGFSKTSLGNLQAEAKRTERVRAANPIHHLPPLNDTAK